MSSRFGRLGIVAVLSLLGVILSVYLSGLYYDLQIGAAGFKSACSISESMNCDAVASSKWAEIFPGFPLSSWAAGWYVAIALFALIARDPSVRKDALRFLWPLTVVAAAASVFYTALMVFVIRKYCLYCMIGHGIDWLNLGLLYTVMKEEKVSLSVLPWSTDLPRERLKAYGITLAACVLGALFTLKVMYLPDSKQARELEQAAAEVLATAPVDIKIDAASPTHGPATAPVTIVEFSDFQCPHCKHGAQILKSVRARYGDQLRVVLRSFPLDSSCNRMIKGTGHKQACKSARVAICSQKQGIFDPVYQQIFENQMALESSDVFTQIQGLSDDQMNALKACVDAPATKALQSQDIEEGIRLGVEATPTYFINGRRVPYQLDAPTWGKLIESLKSKP